MKKHRKFLPLLTLLLLVALLLALPSCQQQETVVPDSSSLSDERPPLPGDSFPAPPPDSNGRPPVSEPAVTTPADTSDPDVGNDSPVTDPPQVVVTPGEGVKNDVTTIVADGTSAVIEGLGAAVTEDVLAINMAGEYILSGKWNGRIIVSVGETDKVKLTLKGFDAVCAYDSVIYVASADKVTVKSQSGYENSLKDTDTREEQEGDTRGKGAVYARSSLEFSGAGKLTVSSSYKHGISCTKKLTVSNGTLDVTAADCGLKGNNSVVIEGGIITVNSEGDAIKTEGEDKEDKGFVTVMAGTLTLTTRGDGISATRRVTVTGGEIRITTTGNDTSSAGGGGWGGPGGGRPGGGRPGGWGTPPGSSSGSTSSANDVSSKGIKAGCDTVGTDAVMELSGGKITVDSTGHSLHSTGNVTVDGTAEITLSSRQKGLQGHGNVSIKGGTIHVLTSTEGLESKGDMQISGGHITVYATDDGINIGTSGKTLTVSGGFVDVTTSSGDTDGIDSNGSVVVTGGVVLVKGGSASGNVSGSIDTDGTVTVNGGTVIALGGICELPSSSSKAYTVRMSGKTFSAGSYTLTDAEGNTVITFTLSGSFRSAWISSDLLTAGGSYTLSRENTRIASWTQSARTVSAS